MNCPICESKNTRVVNVRPHDIKIRRNRRCNECDYSFHTYEIYDGHLMEILEELSQHEIAATLEKNFPMPREYRKAHEKWGR